MARYSGAVSSTLRTVAPLCVLRLCRWQIGVRRKLLSCADWQGAGRTILLCVCVIFPLFEMAPPWPVQGVGVLHL